MKPFTTIVFLGLILSMSTLFHGCALSRDSTWMKQGDALVRQIMEFKRVHGRLPAGLEEMGIEEKEEGPLHYQRIGSDHFQIWFGMSLGESKTWDSKVAKWE